MADTDVSTLDNIFRMITPADLLGAQKLSVGKKLDIPTIKDLLDIIYGTSGALTADQMSEAFKSLVLKSGTDSAEQFKRVLAFFKTANRVTRSERVPSWPSILMGRRRCPRQ